MIWKYEYLFFKLGVVTLKKPSRETEIIQVKNPTPSFHANLQSHSPSRSTVHCCAASSLIALAIDLPNFVEDTGHAQEGTGRMRKGRQVRR